MPRGPASAVGIYRRCANDGVGERARDAQRKVEGERRRKKANEKEREGELERKSERYRERLQRERGCPAGSVDPWSGTPRDAGAEFSTRMSASDFRSTKDEKLLSISGYNNDRLAGTINKQTNKNNKHQEKRD